MFVWQVFCCVIVKIRTGNIYYTYIVDVNVLVHIHDKFSFWMHLIMTEGDVNINCGLVI